jgi:hypothetical protein
MASPVGWAVDSGVCEGSACIVPATIVAARLERDCGVGLMAVGEAQVVSANAMAMINGKEIFFMFRLLSRIILDESPKDRIIINRSAVLQQENASSFQDGRRSI